MNVTVVVPTSRWLKLKIKEKEQVTGIKFPRPSAATDMTARNELYLGMLAEQNLRLQEVANSENQILIPNVADQDQVDQLHAETADLFHYKVKDQVVINEPKLMPASE
jgi:IMP cyclohydrolase